MIKSRKALICGALGAIGMATLAGANPALAQAGPPSAPSAPRVAKPSTCSREVEAANKNLVASFYAAPGSMAALEAAMAPDYVQHNQVRHSASWA